MKIFKEVFTFFGGIILGIILGMMFAYALVDSFYVVREKTRNEILVEYGYAKYGLDNQGNINIIIKEPKEKNHDTTNRN